jgi:hypothetical protein
MTSALASASAWAEKEFGAATLGDKRRNRRLKSTAARLALNPQGVLPGAFPAWAEAKAAYRLLERPEVTFEKVFDPHRQRVRTACHRHGEYLMIEDTTSLDFTSREAARDLGRIGNDGGRGLWVHSTLAVVIERWNDRHEPEVTVEGLFDQRWWARTTPTLGSTREPKRKRMSRLRESDRWAKTCAQERPPDAAHWTWVADRESDIYETFLRCREGGWHFIVRAEQPRALADEAGSVFEAVSESPELGRFFVDLRSRPGHAARRAEVSVRARQVTLRGPWRPGEKLEPMTVNAVEAREIGAPEGVDPIHWVLLTDWPCDTFEAALRVVKAYTRRWLIEDYHKVLKSGTGIEDSQLETAQRITSLLGILSVIAVRLLNLRMLARTRPEQALAPQEIGPEALDILEKTYGKPREGWTYGLLLRRIAQLGGFPGRKGDGSPGCKTLWRGWNMLMILVHGYDLAR